MIAVGASLVLPSVGAASARRMPRRRRASVPDGLPPRRRRRHRRRRRQPGAAARRQREPARRLLPAATRRRRHPAADRGRLRRHRRAGLQRRAAEPLVVGARARARRRSTRRTSTQITDAVDWAKEHGVYIVLDMHQDSWWNGGTEEGTECRPGTDPMWGYDGAPEWATHHRRRTALPVPGARHLAGRQPRVPELLLRHRRHPDARSSRPGASSPRSSRDEPAVAGFDLLNEPGFGETAPVTTSLPARPVLRPRDRGDPRGGRPADRVRRAQHPLVGPRLRQRAAAGLHRATANIVFSPHLYAESLTMDRSLGIPPIVAMERQFDARAARRRQLRRAALVGRVRLLGRGRDVVERLSRYADAEDAHLLGSAYWVWKQACGDPQNGIGRPATTRSWCRTARPATTRPPRDDLLEILSRAYPRSAPGVLTALDGGRRDVDLAGTDRRARLRPRGVGARRRPSPTSTSPASPTSRSTEVPGGWIVTGCADGDYTLSTER